ncbi:glycosyltransferase family 2 protein [Olleya sp. YS]|uniref:glycosyltransferase family A protein n=1 Tax=Olleya sp. YS TaxID=3028318 RepID=UPI0024345AE3|nr:glycosyltransferase family 2 protein [Olleya sp. YS]WGD35140.1 glycosyltransferase family 2 protein [Olleya sp. YS]
MSKSSKKDVDFEILVSTMHRTSLSFLKPMFQNLQLEDYHILIINQTTPDKLLESSHDNIRVVNSFERGLPNSRNLAIKHAIGKICLVADDDVIYVNNLSNIILEAYQKYTDADIVTFKMTDFDGNEFRDYKPTVIHDKKSIFTVNSVVITFNRDSLINQLVEFNPNFGLGAEFKTANEYVFLRNALKSNLKLYFQPKIILSHPAFSSGQDSASDTLIYARAALFYKYSGSLAYFRLIKQLYLLIQLKQLKAKLFLPKFKVGRSGISRYKQLLKEGLETR